MMKEEKELFLPYNAGYLGKTAQDTKKLHEKLDKFGPTAKVNPALVLLLFWVSESVVIYIFSRFNWCWNRQMQ